MHVIDLGVQRRFVVRFTSMLLIIRGSLCGAQITSTVTSPPTLDSWSRTPCFCQDHAPAAPLMSISSETRNVPTLCTAVLLETSHWTELRTTLLKGEYLYECSSLAGPWTSWAPYQ